jgi:hypothetical protein
VPCQPNVQTGFLRAAVPPPFILLSLVSMATNGSSQLVRKEDALAAL